MIHSHSSNQLAEAALCDLLEGKTLGSGSRVFSHLMQEDFSREQARAILTLLATRGETAGELLAAWKAIRRAENTAPSISALRALDTCGTGGDGSHSINLSTLSSFVMAAAGVRIIKHGNRAITSRCGSSDLLTAFGMNLNQSQKKVVQSSDKIGMGYFHAPHVHPVYSSFQNLRREICIRTLFNLLGPVLNPVAVQYQILGVADSKLFLLYAELLPRMGRKNALVVRGAEGMDEITTLGISDGLHLYGKQVKKWSLNPRAFGFKTGRRSDLEIRSVNHSKQKTIEILKNRKPGTALDSVILSAACGIWLAGKSQNMAEGIAVARNVLHSGKAWSVLTQLVEFSKHDS